MFLKGEHLPDYILVVVIVFAGSTILLSKSLCSLFNDSRAYRTAFPPISGPHISSNYFQSQHFAAIHGHETPEQFGVRKDEPHSLRDIQRISHNVDTMQENSVALGRHQSKPRNLSPKKKAALLELQITQRKLNRRTPEKVVLVHQVSSEYASRDWDRFPIACSNKCVRTTNIEKADVVIAHPGKTILKRTRADQVWVANFWESPAHRKPLSLDYDYSISYHQEATFPRFQMITDTFKWDEAHILPVEAIEKKREMPLMSVWISNCETSRRTQILRGLHENGISTTSYGSCRRTSKPSLGDIYSTLDHVTKWDLTQEKSGGQKMAHSSQHMFLFAAENSDCKVRTMNTFELEQFTKWICD